MEASSLESVCLHLFNMETWGWVKIRHFICFLNITEHAPDRIRQQIGKCVDSSIFGGCVGTLNVHELGQGLKFGSSDWFRRMRWTTDNICGFFTVNEASVPRNLMSKVAENDQSEHFYGTNHVFHTVAGRFTVQANNIVDFKGVRCYDDIISFRRHLTGDDGETCDLAFCCQMVASTFHFNFPIDLRHGSSLFLFLMDTYTTSSFRHQASLDQSSLLNYKLIDWQSLLYSVERLWSGPSSPLYTEASAKVFSSTLQPRAFFGVTRNSVFFVRIAMQQGMQTLGGGSVIRPYFVVIGCFFAAILCQMGYPVFPATTLHTLFDDP